MSNFSALPEMQDAQEDKTLKRLREAVGSVQTELDNVNKVTSMSVFASDATQKQAASCDGEGLSGKAKKTKTNDTFYNAYTQFWECSAEQLATLKARALNERSMRKAALQADMEHAQAALRLYVDRTAQENQLVGHRYKAALSSFTPEEHAEIDRELESNKYFECYALFLVKQTSIIVSASNKKVTSCG